MPADEPRCFICTKPATEADRNTDGSYAHAACLAAHATWPTGRTEKGNLYPPMLRPGRSL